MILTGFIRDLGAALPKIRLASESNRAVSVQIISRISSNTFSASIFGRRVTVWSSLDLKPGMTFKTSVAFRGKSVVLKTVAQPSALGKEAGLNQLNQARGIAAETLTRANIPLSAHIIASFADFAAKYKATGKEQFRLAALLFDKGLNPGEENFNALKSFINPLAGREGRGGSEGGRREKDEESGKRAARGMVEKLKKGMKAVEEASSPVLLLFNHIPGRYDNWVIIPFSGEGLAGVIRIKPGENGRAVKSLVVSVSKEGFSCHFSVPRYDRLPRRMSLYVEGCEPEKLPGEILHIFRQNIEKFRCVLDDTINTCDDFDGFSEMSGYSYTDIDFEV